MQKTLSLSAFLAVKEVWRNRGRFLLVSLVIALITLLVLFGLFYIQRHDCQPHRAS